MTDPLALNALDRALLDAERDRAPTVTVRTEVLRGLVERAKLAPHVGKSEKGGIAAIFGKWPGDETDAQIVAALNGGAE